MSADVLIIHIRKQHLFTLYEASGLNVVLYFISRASIGLGLQSAYDAGGLTESTFLHFWYDMITIMTLYVFSAGVPSTSPGALRPVFSVDIPI